MSEDPRLTEWFRKMAEGDLEAANSLIEYFFPQLIAFSEAQYRQKFPTSHPVVEDAEDAAQSALKTLWRRSREGRFSDVVNRNQLWRLLAKITLRKIYAQRKRATAKRRGGIIDKHIYIGSLKMPDACLPAQESQAELHTNVRDALDALTDPVLRNIAALRLNGTDVKDIAEELDLSPRTIQRWIKEITETWEKLFLESPDPPKEVEA